ncbi:MAG TPA: tetratricopeptide repeat protein, partial [Puia sp.]|nr:tetratricopeptide repeat protein [Puia sp.]
QDSITVNDALEIKYRAKSLIESDLRDLMNGVSDVNAGANDVNEMIANSYSNKTKKIFLSKENIIEDDINPNFHSSNKTSDLKVEQYFKELDLKYKKSDGQSIVFVDISVSNVKKTKLLYVKVYFSSIFKNPHKYIDTAYAINNRVAEINLEKVDNKWVAYISSIRFYSPADTINDNSTDIQLVREKGATGGAVTLDSASLAAQQKSLEEKLKQAKDKELIDDEKKEREQFLSYINMGDKASDQNDFNGALDYYKKAGDLRPYDNLVRGKINSVYKKKDQSSITNEQLFQGYMHQALLAEREREYEKAINFYDQAFEKKPEERSKNDAHVNGLRKIFRDMSVLEAKYKSGLYKETIKEYKDLIKKNENVSDYYLGMAKCYDKLNDFSKSLKNYQLAIEKDSRNLEAIRLEADLYKRNKDLFNALGDYKSYLSISKENSAIYDSIAKLNILTNNDVGQAIQVLSDGITVNPKSGQLYLDRGLFWIDKKNYKNAIDDFSNVIDLNSNDAFAYYSRGRCQLSVNHVDLAAKDFESARQNGLNASYIKNIQTFADHLFNQASQKFDKGEKDSAIKMIDMAIAVDPYNSAYHFSRGEYYFSINNYKEAIHSYDEAVRLNSSYADAFYKRGLSYYHLADYKTALKDFKDAHGINAQHFLAQKGAGDADFASADYSGAASEYEKYIQIIKTLKNAPDAFITAQVYNSMGKSYFYLNNYQQAIEAFKSAIKTNIFGEAYFNRGLAYYKLNQLSSAIDDYKKAIDLEQKHYLWYYYLARAHQDNKEFENAIARYNSCIGLDTLSKMPDAIYRKGYCKLQLKNYIDAVQDYSKYKSLHLDSAEHNFDYEFANIYFNLEKYDSALLYYNQAYSKDTTNAHAMYGVASSLFFKSKADEAMVWYEKAFVTKAISKSEIKKDKNYSKLNEDAKFKALVKKYY